MKQETKCIQAGYEPGNGESRMIPIIQSTTFKYDSSEAMGRLFDLEERLLPGRRLPFIRYLTSAAQAIMSYLPLRYMAEHITCLP